jgi:hypothetical protein
MFLEKIMMRDSMIDGNDKFDFKNKLNASESNPKTFHFFFESFETKLFIFFG